MTLEMTDFLILKEHKNPNRLRPCGIRKKDEKQ
jgi:hypothetical protein